MNNGRLEQLKKLLEDAPNDPFVTFALAKEYHKLGNLEKAIEIYQSLIKNQPDYTGTYYHLAHLLLEAKQPQQAVAIFEQGLRITAQVGDHHAHGELKRALAALNGDEDED